MEEEETSGYIHSDVLIPLALKTTDFLDPQRVVLYREDCREIPYVLREEILGGRISPN